MKTLVAFCLLLAGTNAATFKITSSNTAVQIANSKTDSKVLDVETDAGNVNLTYKVTDGEENFNFMNSSGPTLVNKKEWKPPQEKEYTVNITVEKDPNDSVNQTITVTIKPFAFDSATYKNTVPNNAEIGAAVTAVTAIPGTGRIVTYSLENSTTDFAIDGSSGKITVATSNLTIKMYSFTVTADDGASLNATASVEVDVTDGTAGAAALFCSLVLIAMSMIATRL